MYTESDATNAQREKRISIIICCIPLALMLVCVILGIVLRIEPLATWAPALLACVFYLLFDMKAMPNIKYCRYLNDIKQGLSRQTDAEFISIADVPRQSNGVMFYDFTVNAQDGEKLFYYDADKERPSLVPGEAIHITSFGNYITALTSASV